MTPFERLAQREFFGIKLGLDNVRALLTALDHPERVYQRVIVAGTNGKGSVCAILSRALHVAGHRVGLYTSPHLVDLTERFRIDERDVTTHTLESVLAGVFEVEEGLRADGRLAAPATYFELTTVAAFELFRRSGVEIAVLEVGLGGRFDATNAAEAEFAAITSVGFDHMAQLGATLEAIATEKAGVIQPHAVVVTGVRAPDAARVIGAIATQRCARLVDATADVRTHAEQRGLQTWASWQTPQSSYGPLPLALRGEHQAANAAVAIRMLEVLSEAGRTVPGAAIETALREAVWPGRLQVVQVQGRRSVVVIDGAHNTDGAAALAAWLDQVGLCDVTLVTAVMRDKDVVALLGPLVTRAASAIVTRVLPPRGLASDELMAVITAVAPSLPVTMAGSTAEAVDLALRTGSPVVVAGSLFLAGEALRALADRGDLP